MSRAVVLNSGGFDSVVLMNYVHTILGVESIHSLHFLYGAPNEKEQLKCVTKVCRKLGATNKVIKLPPIDWTQSKFFTDGPFQESSQYLEYRNLIFLSYAISYAEAIKADTIYVAFINNGSTYPDTSQTFIDGLNHFCTPSSGIFVIAPFIDHSKYSLGHFAKYFKIRDSEYFSCDKPVNGKPCGECIDCISIREVKDFVNSGK